MKTLLAGAAVALALLGAGSSAQAAVITWTLQDVTFEDGGTAFGFFDYDTILGAAENFDITTTAGGDLPGFHYTPSTGFFGHANLYVANSLLWLGNNSVRYILLGFTGPLGTPGTMALANGRRLSGSYECDNCLTARFLTGGSVTTNAPVPEPASWALMLTGFLGAGAALRTARRRQGAIAA